MTDLHITATANLDHSVENTADVDFLALFKSQAGEHAAVRDVSGTPGQFISDLAPGLAGAGIERDPPRCITTSPATTSTKCVPVAPSRSGRWRYPVGSAWPGRVGEERADHRGPGVGDLDEAGGGSRPIRSAGSRPAAMSATPKDRHRVDAVTPRRCRCSDRSHRWRRRSRT